MLGVMDNFQMNTKLFKGKDAVKQQYQQINPNPHSESIQSYQSTFPDAGKVTMIIQEFN
jgi:aspartate ammonia-lyase